MKVLYHFIFAAVLATSISVLPSSASAQYFGRNKVQYEQFDFRVLETAHYRLHFYSEEEEPARDMGRMAERWNARLSTLFDHQLRNRKPILLYANQPDFQQTNAVTEQLTEGTGGITESLRDRLIMPLTGVYRDNDHVLGHEMVHEFQYDVAHDPKARGGPGGGQGGAGGGIDQLPLWVIEGQAEYLSLGRDDPNTAMWMRDAVIQNKLPTIKQLTNDTRFFPYRYGEALWAYVGGKYGDKAVVDVFKSALRYGFEGGIKKVLGISSDSLSKDWIAATRAAYAPMIAARTNPSAVGQPLLPPRKTGESNLSPVISPDGRYVAFFAARNLFGFDLYIADAATGKSIKQLANLSTSTDFDALSFISSAGTWSPDGRKFAFIVYAKGNQQIAVLDVASQNIERHIDVPGVGAIQNPEWSPDGNSIAFSGTDGGVSDLYVYDIAANRAKRLTHDRFADIQPSWSPDGRSLVFSTDRASGTDFTTLTHGPLRLAIIDVATGSIRPLDIFQTGKHINPRYTPDGQGIYFISDHSGVSDLYRFTLATGAVTQITNVATGVSGITDLSPAFSVSQTSGRLVFSAFEKQGYGIFALNPDQTVGAAVQQTAQDGGILPPADAFATSTVVKYLADASTGLPPDGNFKVSPYHASLALAAAGQPTAGVAVGTGGTYVGGGTSFLFTDILGNRNLGIGVQATGTLQDIGGEVMYQSLEHRFNWAIDAAHSPYATSFATASLQTVNTSAGPQEAEVIQQFTQRIYVDQLTFITQYPFSTVRRAELSVSATRLGFGTRVDQLVAIGNQVIDQSSFDTTSAPSIRYGQVGAALVGDNSYFGFTGPIIGWRYRFELAPTFGDFQFENVTADARKYVFWKPVTLAVRGMHFGRYGKDANSLQLTPLFVGDPTLVRGYSAESFDPLECTTSPTDPTSCPEFDRLVGSRIVAASAELRIPLFGNDQLGLLRSPLFPVDIAPFVDAGLAWSAGDSVSLSFSRTSAARVPVFSAGISARANLFGYAVLEAYYAHPFQRPQRSWVFGFQLAPGW
jgi:hypothetical protein